MTKLIIQHLWSDFKKHWLGILVYIGIVLYCYHFCVYLWYSGFSWWIQKLTCFSEV